ncbi:unnamed protein product [Toxocara canis]|uniref:Phospholipid scramblase n=1 Tax=Toxocara canis TaxID=6265 RepID=A0A183U669_TOXCA|nr:unnamed protein product [Toxocara canis]
MNPVLQTLRNIPVRRSPNAEQKTTLNLLNLSAAAKAAILGQTHHPTSVARIKEIEAPKAPPAEAPELKKEAPRFIKPLSDGQMVYVTEGDSVFLEAQVVPTDDNTMTVSLSDIFVRVLNVYPSYKVRQHFFRSGLSHLLFKLAPDFCSGISVIVAFLREQIYDIGIRMHFWYIAHLERPYPS